MKGSETTRAPGARHSVAIGIIRRGVLTKMRVDNTRPAPAHAVRRLRIAARAAGYDVNQPASLTALACVTGIDATRLSAGLTGRAELRYDDEIYVARALGLTPAAMA